MVDIFIFSSNYCIFLLDAKQCNISNPYGGRGTSSHPEQESFEMGSSRNNGEGTSMVRNPHNKKKKNSINDEESTQEGKFKKNETNDEVRSFQFEEDPLKGCSSHNLPSERLSKGIPKKSKKAIYYKYA